MTRLKENSIRKLKAKEVPQFQAYLRSLVGNSSPPCTSQAVSGLPEAASRPSRGWSP